MRANGTATMGHKDLVKEIGALKAQLKKLSSAMEAEATDGVGRALTAMETKSKEAIDGAIEAAQGFIDNYADGARDAAAALSKKTAEIRDSATDSIVESMKERPLGTLAAIVGLGFVAGYLCRRA
ncbi:MAG: hypothetical protein NTV97_00230 [Alphaproteobacteria bacterium]|nr:hypothetical protein [Alphaproteobacteria bacterium]